MKIAKSVCLLVWVCLLMYSAIANGQTAATVSGIVTDPRGAVVPNTTISLTNVNTGVVSTTLSNSEGFYRISNLQPGTYKAAATKEGFKAVVKTSIDLHVEDAISLNFSLEVGSVIESVSVEASAQQLQSDSTTVSSVIESRQIENTPLNGRNVFNLLALAPGVVPQGSTTGSPLNNQPSIGNFTNPAGWGNYQIGGGVAGQNAQFLDGAPLGTPIQNWLILVPGEDAVQEFRVESNNVSAEYGRYYGGVISFSTKAGTNAFHGSGYEYFRNTVLDANNFFNKGSQYITPPAGFKQTPRPVQQQNQYGVSLGGPIKKDHLFFFGNWEGFANRGGLPYIARVPTQQERSGDFTADKPVMLTNGTQVSCNGVLNKVCLDPTADYITNTLKYWPIPNVPNVPEGGLNFQTNASSGSNSNQVTGRVDYHLGKHQLFGRYTWWGTYTLPTNYFHNDFPQPYIDTRTNQGVFGDTYAINPSTVADVRLSYSRFIYNTYPPNFGKIDLSKFPGIAPFAGQVTFNAPPEIFLIGYSNPYPLLIINLIQQNTFTTWRLSANITKIIGRHSLRFGGESQRISLSRIAGNLDPTGQFAFVNFTPTNNIFANFLLGQDFQTSSHITTSARFRVLEPYAGLYVTDTFTVNPKLTVHAGVRWDLPGGFSEKNNLDTMLSPGVASPLGSITNPVTNQNQALKGNLVLVNSPDYPSRYDNSLHLKLFAPNVGFNYRLFPRTAISSGYSLNYVAYDTGNPSALSAPINNLTTVAQGPLSNPFPQVHGVLPQPVGRNPAYSAAIQGLAIAGRVSPAPFGYAQQWNFNVQQQIGSTSIFGIGYVGSKGTHLPITLNLNPIPDSAAAQAVTQYQSLLASGKTASQAEAGTTLMTKFNNPLAGKLASGSIYNGSLVNGGQFLRPFPQFGNVSDASYDEGSSIYHSLQATYRVQFRSSGTVFISYSWSKLIGTVDTNTGFLETSSVGGIQDPNNLAGERSLESFDVPQRLVLNYSLLLPFGKGRYLLGNSTPVVDHVVSGWSVSSITTFQKGFPLALTTTGANDLSANFGFGAIRPNVVAGCDKRQTSATINPTIVRPLNNWFNTSCFVQPPTPFSIGNEGRTDSMLRTPGISNWDIALTKDTAIHEQVRLLFTAQFLNAFNHTQFGPPGVQLGSTTFGEVTNQINNPRQIQFGARVSF